MPNWTPSEYNRYLQKYFGLSPVPGEGNPVVQEQQTGDSGPDNNQPQKPGDNGADNHRFRVSITLCYSSLYNQDIDGGATTILDCLISAIGRLAQVDKRTLRKVAASAKRKRRGHAKD
jgi:hypothetical protein